MTSNTDEIAGSSPMHADVDVAILPANLNNNSNGLTVLCDSSSLEMALVTRDEDSDVKAVHFANSNNSNIEAISLPPTTEVQ